MNPGNMSKKEFDKSAVFRFDDSIEYSSGAVVSKTIIKNQSGNISLFAFDKGQDLSEHIAPYDALVQIIDGTSEIIIDKKSYRLSQGQSIILPANVPHALQAIERFKMVLIMIKEVAS